MFFQNDWGDYFQQNIAKEVITFGGFLKWWIFPPNHPMFNGGFPLFSPSILGIPLFLGNTHIRDDKLPSEILVDDFIMPI